MWCVSSWESRVAKVTFSSQQTFMQCFCFKRECLMDCGWQCFQESFVWILAQGALLLRVEAPLGLEPKLPPMMHREMHGRFQGDWYSMQIHNFVVLSFVLPEFFHIFMVPSFTPPNTGRMGCWRFLVPFEEGHVRAYYYMLAPATSMVLQIYIPIPFRYLNWLWVS